MSTTYLQRIVKGMATTPQEWNEHLVTFHRRFENATCGPFSLMRTAHGETSYQVLARRTLEMVPNAQSILDLGCGEGFLLRKLRRLRGPRAELVGIDLSDAEIERARALNDDITFICGDARSADLGAARFDAVVSHLVLMIASEPEAMLRAVHGSLRASGYLLAMVQDFPVHESFGALLTAAIDELKRTYQSFLPEIPNRVRFEDADELGALLDASGFTMIDYERYEVRAWFTPAEVWAFMQRIYHYGLFESPVRERIQAVTEAAMQPMIEDGRFEVVFPLRLLIARA